MFDPHKLWEHTHTAQAGRRGGGRQNRLWPRCGACGGESVPLTRFSITCTSGGSCVTRLLRIQPHQSTLVREKAGVAITFRIIRWELLLVSVWFKSHLFRSPYTCTLNTRTVPGRRSRTSPLYLHPLCFSQTFFFFRGKKDLWKWRRCVQLQKDKINEPEETQTSLLAVLRRFFKQRGPF